MYESTWKRSAVLALVAAALGGCVAGESSYVGIDQVACNNQDWPEGAGGADSRCWYATGDLWVGHVLDDLLLEIEDDTGRELRIDDSWCEPWDESEGARSECVVSGHFEESLEEFEIYISATHDVTLSPQWAYELLLSSSRSS